ncbi:protein translocase subunit SecF [Candidatus Kaiserbacteria bacterium CG_4_8_14_3_um_filter_50_23]|uniref:Protein-export membrane protein SecF n=1 Tax=Candidatus Kaiserbacteria bacterium CG17_big_fil_post_rev_8_21_14_2_50_51_7 TaxID=1974613 RepID=A0A2M7FBI7_9BACT|nr:MAG: protein translocase subunit SecF [Candidatus Kaiserbacteria bacterium CG17_big_fil_post_rev_8_21_14_2_50_51_7]PIW96370.1 MAG: protein translocase subunit SecF [Candidatus Kaiserbacteria bacterium CG_4_8_14_3_um_filter_50_23]
MNITIHRTVYFWITGLILAAAFGAILFFGLPLDIDFTGGSLMQVGYQNERPLLADIQKQIAVVPLGVISVRASGANAVSIRTRTLTPFEHSAVLTVLSQSASTTELSYTSVGPTLGGQFAHKALWAILAVALAIILYIAFAFRKVSRPVPSWGYGLTVIAILVHDLIIPAGFFAILAHFTGARVDALFVTALLALLGYSVNDTIIIFDRIREHLARNEKIGSKELFEQTVGKSISETMTRSINTSLTVVLALLSLVILGASATRVFAFVMLVGVIAGTYSSILLAAPLLIPLARYFVKK